MDSTQRTRPRSGGSPVGLVIFIILTVILAVLSYWGFAKYKEADTQRLQAIAKQTAAENNLAKIAAEKKAFADASGVQSGEMLKSFVKTMLDKTNEVGFGSEAQQNAKDAVDVAVKALGALKDENAKLQASVTDLTAKIKAIEEQRKASDTAYGEELAKKIAEIASLNKKIDETKAQWQAKLDKEIATRRAVTDEYYTAQDQWKDAEMKYILHVAELKDKLSELTGEGAVLGKADGVVLKVDHRDKWTTIDIGSTAGVKAGMRFVVYTKDVSGNPMQKGVLEVLKTEPEVSVCQILSTKAGQAVGKGDYIYNLAGPEKRLFVFAGKPQIYTTQEWTNFIRANGGDVVEEVQNGDQVADYLIMGTFEKADRRVADKVRAARDFGLTILTEKKLQEVMGLI